MFCFGHAVEIFGATLEARSVENDNLSALRFDESLTGELPQGLCYPRSSHSQHQSEKIMGEREQRAVHPVVGHLAAIGRAAGQSSLAHWRPPYGPRLHRENLHLSQQLCCRDLLASSASRS